MNYQGSYNTGSTVRFMFTTHAQTGARSDPSSAFEAADFLIYKDGSATERASTNGVTVTSTFDSKTGVHLLAIDTSDNSDLGFFAAGSEYHVLLYPDETVDSFAVAKVVGTFSLERSVSYVVTAIWAQTIEGTVTALQAMRGILAALLGKCSGLGGTSAVYRNTLDTKDRITGTVDADGNRSAVTLDLT